MIHKAEFICTNTTSHNILNAIMFDKLVCGYFRWLKQRRLKWVDAIIELQAFCLNSKIVG